MLCMQVPAGSRVLDIGAGPGEPTTTMAKRMPENKFVVTDKQHPMLERAKVRTEGLSNVQHVLAPAEDLSAFPDASFDAATGCYVLMFVDFQKALAEVARVLKPRGVAFLTVWNEVALYSLTRTALAEMFKRHKLKGHWRSAAHLVPVNPMALSPTEPNFGRSTIEKEIAAMLQTVFKITAKEDIAYEMNLGSVEEMCAVSFILATPFDQIASYNGKTEAEIKEMYCDVFQELATARAAKGDKADGHAKIYTLEKLPEREL